MPKSRQRDVDSLTEGQITHADPYRHSNPCHHRTWLEPVLAEEGAQTMEEILAPN
jgi:hypothetical protein